jgi:hypothetical protein
LLGSSDALIRRRRLIVERGALEQLSQSVALATAMNDEAARVLSFSL